MKNSLLKFNPYLMENEFVKVSEDIAKLVAYVPGKPISETQREFGVTKVYKLASNENPLGVSEKVLEALRQGIHEIHRYPDSACYELKQAAAKYFNMLANSMVFGNGSNELIDLLIRVYCEAGDAILTSQAAFVAYKICAQVSRVKVTEVPLLPDLRFDLKAIQKAWTPKHKIIFIANPNNPTGTYVSKKEVDDFLSFFGNRDDVWIVFDEAYVEFVRAKDYPNALEYRKQFKNVIVLRTMSKVFGLAGLRLGCLFGCEEVVDYLDRIRNPFNVNSLAQIACIAAFKDSAYIQRTQKETWAGLDYFYQELKKLGLPYYESQANFVLFDTKQEAALVSQKLLKKGVILRPVKNYGFDQLLRISVGTREENEAAVLALKDVL